MSNVYAQITIDLELDEHSVNGTQLDLLGLSSVVKEYLENLPMSGPQMRVLNVAPSTKDWEIAAQLNMNVPFPLQELYNIPECGD
jgi:hypothetical protein